MKPGIEYADEPGWNPYSGCTMNGCAVAGRCWAHNMARRLRGRYGYDSQRPFKPTFHEDKLDVPLRRKKPTRFASCFMGDIADARKEWLERILAVVEATPRHRYYFLTKRPDEVAQKRLKWPDNAWVGVTVNSQDDIWRIIVLRDCIDARVKYASLEPLYGRISHGLEGLDWLIIGAQTNPELQPERLWVSEVVLIADRLGIPIFTKPNLNFPQRHEFPEVSR